MSEKAKIVVEIDGEEAKRQIEALKAEMGGGGGGGGSVPGSPARPAPRAPSGGGGGMGMPGMPGGLAGTAAMAVFLVAMKDVIRDGLAPLKTLANDVSNAVRQGIDKLTGGGLSNVAGESRAFESAFEKTRAFGKETLGKASPEATDAYFRMQMMLERMKESGDRAVENQRLKWSPGLPSAFR